MGMWRRDISIWVVLQLLLGVPLFVVPVVLVGAVSLAVTLPIYVVLVVFTVLRETSRNKRQQRSELLRKMNAIVSDFLTLTEGGHGSSVWAILRDLRGNAQFRAQMEMSGNTQAGELLDERCQRLFSDAGNLTGQGYRIDEATTDDQLTKAVMDFGGLVVEYRKVVHVFLRFLEDTRGDKETIQHKLPFSTRVHRDLADEHDRLMDNIRQIREELRQYVGHDWLPDQHLTRFPRASLWG